MHTFAGKVASSPVVRVASASRQPMRSSGAGRAWSLPHARATRASRPRGAAPRWRAGVLHPGDIADPATPKVLVRETVTTFGLLDFAYNNAGVDGRFAPLADRILRSLSMSSIPTCALSFSA